MVMMPAGWTTNGLKYTTVRCLDRTLSIPSVSMVTTCRISYLLHTHYYYYIIMVIIIIIMVWFCFWLNFEYILSEFWVNFE